MRAYGKKGGGGGAPVDGRVYVGRACPVSPAGSQLVIKKYVSQAIFDAWKNTPYVADLRLIAMAQAPKKQYLAEIQINAHESGAKPTTNIIHFMASSKKRAQTKQHPQHSDVYIHKYRHEPLANNVTAGDRSEKKEEKNVSAKSEKKSIRTKTKDTPLLLSKATPPPEHHGHDTVAPYLVLGALWLSSAHFSSLSWFAEKVWRIRVDMLHHRLPGRLWLFKLKPTWYAQFN